MKSIFLDMDGCVTNFIDQFLTAIGSDLTHDQVSRWDVNTLVGMTEDQLWERINDCGEKFWSEMPKYEWADELFYGLQKYGSITYLSSPGRSPMACSGKLKWIQKNHGMSMAWMLAGHGPGQLPPKFLLAKRGAVLIDDSDTNCLNFITAGGDAILVPQPWNTAREHVGDRIGYVWEKMNLLTATK